MKKYTTKEGVEYNSFIYRWEDTLNKKYYIGSHVGSTEDGYLFGGIDIKKEYKLRPKDFNREILSYHIICEHKNIRDIEREYLIKYDVENNNNFYNRTNESYGGFHKKSVEKRLLDIDENGLNAFQRASKKMVETRKKKNNYKSAKIKEYETKNNNLEVIKQKISNTLKGSIWVNKNGLVKYIKQNEIDFYEKNGWNTGRKNYSYNECRKFAIANNIKSAIHWKKICKSNNMPYNPNLIFKNEWTSWEDFLGKLKIVKNSDYNSCKEFAKNMNIKTAKEWIKMANENNMPTHPERKFKNDWTSWTAFLHKDQPIGYTGYADSDRDYWMNADESLKYGIIDEIIKPRKK